MPQLADIVRITDSIRPRGELRKDFGVTLFLTKDDTVLGAKGSGRLRTYGRHEDVAEDFGSGTEPYAAAERYFQQSPFPRPLVIARWADSNASTTILGGGTPATVATLKAVTDGSFLFGGEKFTALTLAAASAYAAIAAAVQVKIRASSDSRFASVAVTYSATAKRFEVTDSAYGEFDALFAEAVTGGAVVGTDLSGLMKLDADEATYQQGSASQTVRDALDDIADNDASWYYLTYEHALNDTADMTNVSEWAAARSCFNFSESNAAAVLVTNESTSLAALLSATEPQRTGFTWSRDAEYKAVSAAARMSGVNLDGINSQITMNLKVLEGCTPDQLSATQIKELRRKNINFYTEFGSSNAYSDGRTLKPGTWIDVRVWLDWFVNAVQVDVFNLLYSSGRVPQTLGGVAAIRGAIEGVCRRGLRNGGIASGTVSQGLTADIRQSTGNEQFDGVLSTGYLIYSLPLSEQSQSEREAREGPPFKVWLKGSGAIHNIDIDITFEN